MHADRKLHSVRMFSHDLYGVHYSVSRHFCIVITLAALLGSCQSLLQYYAIIVTVYLGSYLRVPANYVIIVPIAYIHALKLMHMYVCMYMV